MEPIIDIPLSPTLVPLKTLPRAAFARLATMGFRHVQLSAMQPGLRPRDMGRSGRRDLLATVRRHELTISGIDAWIPPEHFVESAHADRAVGAMVEIVEMAGELDRCPVSFSFPRASDGSMPGALAPIRAAIVARAQASGVPLADHGRPAVPDDLVGVGVDPAAHLSDGGDPLAAVSAAGGRLVAARLADLDAAGLRAPIGAPGGRLDAVAYRVTLSVAGFRGPVIIDVRQWIDPWGGVRQTLETW